ncbi:threonine--tRNA ligase, partial [Patescibacteria group bacterium]|nr:threonine--tRNA ligase [Patescibacteria group bacterium]
MQNEKLHNLRHSLAHILASAVLEMFPKAKLGVGPVIENGFYYDFLLPRALTPEDLGKLEKRMRELVKQRLDFKREEMTFAEAEKFFKERGQDFKVELIRDIQKHGTTVFKDITGDAVGDKEKPSHVSLYHTGKFTDLCRGGHVNNTSEIKPDSFKLEKTSGAYWRGDQANPQMQRIYGLAFESKEELDKYILLQEELAKRDHRVLGPKLGLFLFNELSPGIPFYQPNGMIVRNELEKFVREISYGPGYSEVKLPQMFDAELWKTSGHWEHFKDDMFTFKVEGKDFALKPMNCPGHMLLFKQGLYSYKDLPLRFAEMTTLFRNELSGALGGMTRVRAFAQDDCHIFLTPEQVSDEVAELLKRTKKIYKIFGMGIEDVYLATRPEKALGTKEEWTHAENQLEQALKKAKWKYEINPGDGAFYGPKIDMKIKDSLGRQWQLATIQLDFQQPKRFGLEYVDQDGSKKTPIVIHRALLGSFERFMAILIEQYAGALPAWLSPVQAIVLPISRKQNKYARDVQKQLLKAMPGTRLEVDDRDESIGKKIREAQM